MPVRGGSPRTSRSGGYSVVVVRLKRAGLSRAAVNFHIDYLARAKLRVKVTAAEKQEGEPAKADWQRAAIVTLALQFDLVRHEHLALLPA